MFLTASTENPVLAGLDPEQQEAVLAPIGPVCVLAGAGTGKTRAITHRIAYLVRGGDLPAGQLLAVTFTARAAGQMRARLRTLGVDGVQARTFHAAALRQLGYFWPTAIGGRLPRLVDSKLALVRQAVGSLRMSVSRTELRDLTAEIEWAKSSLVGPDGYVDGARDGHRQPPRELELVGRLYSAYEDVKRSAGVLDFDDLLLLTAAMLEERRSVADELRARYRHFVVDEYQDVNPLQQRLLDAWIGERDSVCVVGDANQTIYSFTGASPSYLLDFRRRFPHAAVVKLVRDYRSTPQVVALANAVLDRAPATGRSAAARLRLVAQRADGPQPEWVESDSEPAEAAEITRRIRRLVEAGMPPSEIVVLYRVNAQSETYEAALAAASIPYVLRGGERFFERPEVREAVVLLRGAARAADQDRPTDLSERVAEVLSTVGWRSSAPPQAGAGAQRERWENLAALARLADELAAVSPDATLEQFVADLADRANHQHAPTVEGVTLASLHAAKGLEWDAVFLVGLVDGTVPIVHAETAEQIEEERRLLYVGLTRARVHLTLSWALARAEGGRRTRRPSRFLEGLLPEADRNRGRGGRQDGPAGRSRSRTPVRCRVCARPLAGTAIRLGRCEGCPSDLDEGLFERLRAWRATRAKEQGQPAFCVFTDATLLALAEHRPRTVAELVAVPGIGQAKLDRYGADVLSLIEGA